MATRKKKKKTAEIQKSPIDWYVVNAVRTRRQDLGWTQQDLADKLSVSVGFIGKAESPNYPTHYNLQHLNLIAKVMKCSPQLFMPAMAL